MLDVSSYPIRPIKDLSVGDIIASRTYYRGGVESKDVELFMIMSTTSHTWWTIRCIYSPNAHRLGHDRGTVPTCDFYHVSVVARV